LALSSREASALVRLTRETGLKAAVNFNYRHNVMIEEFRARLQQEENGRTMMIHGRYMQDWLMYETDFDWRLNSEMGGNSRAVADIGAHLFDLCQYVTRDRIVSVFAKLMILHKTRFRYEKPGNTFSTERGDLLEKVVVSNEDAAYIIAKFAGGAYGQFNVSQVAAGHKNDLAIFINTTKCSISWQQEESELLHIKKREEGNLTLYRGGEMLSKSAKRIATMPQGHGEGWNEALKNAIQCFYQDIDGTNNDAEHVRYADIEDGAYILRIIEACMKSDSDGRWTDV
jgi:predicted dehydrogenase